MKKTLFTSLSVMSAAMLTAQQSERPNVIFFLADDLGWTDLSCYGSKFYETPNLDQLAREGMLFTNAYAACPVSSPTRVSIQTGKYPARVGVTDFIRGRYHQSNTRAEMQKICPVLPPDNLFNMPLEEVTIAEALKPYGYQTAHIGKWHVAEDSLYFPQYQGYDINIAGCGKGSPGPGGYFVPYNNPYLKDGPEGEYLTDRLGNECVKILNKFKGKPFFINFPFYQVHTPLIGKPDKVRYFEEKARKMGLDTITRVFDENPDWKSKQPFKTKSYRDRLVQNHATYAAMISSMDENIGKVIAELKRLGLYDNTIIIFTGDNGGLSTSEGTPTSNLPLKAGKGHLYEGGIREPLIAFWKGHVPANTVNESVVSSVDYYPTILDLVNVPFPQKHIIDGKSVKPAFMGAKQDRGAIFWHYPHYPNQGSRPGGAIRIGDYKLIEFYDTGELELYNLKNDIGEHHNLASKEKQRADKMAKQLNAWRKSVKAKMPTKNPAYVYSVD
ncbi:MAG: sulfatase [Paludibacter sp.]|nr:sulfatase [Paludibacter sp.]